MKKFFYLFAFVALMGLSACDDSDDPVSTISYTVDTNNRALSQENPMTDPRFSQTTTEITLDMNNYTIALTGSVVLTEGGETVHFTTPTVKLSYNYSGYYVFMSNETNNTRVTGVNGYLDYSTGMLWYYYEIDGLYWVYASSHLLYATTTTTITSETGSPYTHSWSAYCFVLDSSGKTCQLQISNLVTSSTGTVTSSVVKFNGLTVVPTRTGYTITADELTSTEDGSYKLKNVKFEITDQGLTLAGSFAIDEHNFAVSGKAFATSASAL